MQRFTAWLGAVAMFTALLTAPLYHSHDLDDHGTPVSLVHAHFLDEHSSEHHSDNSFENRHSHSAARWVDFFNFNSPQPGFDLAIELAETGSIIVIELKEDTHIFTVPRSHGPPDTRHSVPRSPPAV